MGGHISKQTQLLQKTNSYNKGIIFRKCSENTEKEEIHSTCGGKRSFIENGLFKWALTHRSEFEWEERSISSLGWGEFTLPEL